LVLESVGLAYLMVGRAADTDAVLRQIDRETSPCAPVIAQRLAQLTYAELLFFRGERRAALDVARAVSESGPTDETDLGALLALHLMARIQSSPVGLQSLEQAAARADFRMAETYVAHARAVDAEDPSALERTAELYESFNLHWLAAETAAKALTLAGSRQGSASSRVRLKRIVSHLQDLESVVLPAWWDSAAINLTPLTEREKQIAEIAATGVTAAQIAEQLGLSRRTIENHIQHIFRKYGISSREELARSLMTQRPVVR
jgi:DNA-binding CsgD family transcriptional regulator